MTMRQDETDVNFVDIKPADMQRAAEAMREEISAVRRAWDKTHWTLEYARKTYPQDARLIEALDTIRHYLESRM